MVMEINQNLHSTKRKNNTVTILIIIIVIILGIAGYFAYRYYTAKNEAKMSSTEPTTTKTTTKRDVGDIMNLLRYPQAETLTNGDKVSSTQVDGFTMETDDSLAVVYNYYMNLIEEYYWSLGIINMDAQETSAIIGIDEKDFQAEINITSNSAGDTTGIVIDIKTGSFEPSNDHEYLKLETSSSPSPTPTTSSEASANANKEGKVTISTDYVLPNSDTEVIDTSELESLSPWELKVARNEIYARHGRSFVHEDMQCYFDSKSWYEKKDNFSETDLTSTDIKNISIILEYEKSIDSPVMNKDLGC